MLTKKQKAEIVEDLINKLKQQKVLIFTDFRGLKTSDLRDLRKQLKEANSEYKVAKKTLTKLALEKTGIKDINLDEFTGSIGLVFGYSDPVVPAKIVNNFSKNHEHLEVLGGIMDNKLLTAKNIKELATIPSKVELIAKLIGSLKSPLYGLTNILQGNIRGLIFALKAITSES